MSEGQEREQDPRQWMYDQEYYAEDTFGGMHSTGRVYTGVFELMCARATSMQQQLIVRRTQTRTNKLSGSASGSLRQWRHARCALLDGCIWMGAFDWTGVCV